MQERKPLALITGAAIRIGAEMATLLASKKFDLILHYFNSEVEVKLLAQKLEHEFGIKTYIFQANLTQSEGAANLMNFIKTKIGYLDLLINNASIFKQTYFLEESDQSIIDNINIHISAPIILAKYFARLESSNGQKQKLINILDKKRITDDVIHSYGEYFIYSLTKHNSFIMHKYLEKELKDKITVFGVAFGDIIPNQDNIAYFKKNNITTEVSQKKIQAIGEIISDIIDSSEMPEDYIFTVE